MANKYLKTLLFFIFISTGVFAQVEPPPPPTPIDGGIMALIALAVGYGVKKIHDNSKR